MEIKKRAKCSIEKYIIISSFSLRPSNRGTEPSEGNPGGKKQRLSLTAVNNSSYTIYNSTVIVLCLTWQEGDRLDDMIYG